MRERKEDRAANVRFGAKEKTGEVRGQVRGNKGGERERGRRARGTNITEGESGRGGREKRVAINLRAVLIEINEVGTITLRLGRRVGRLICCEVH